MNIKQFKEFAADLPDDTLIVTRAPVDAYRECTIEKTTALRETHGPLLNEDFGEEVTLEDEYGIRIPVIIIE